MGTYAIYRQLQHHWAVMSHPIYRADLRRLASARLLKRDPLYPIGMRHPDYAIPVFLVGIGLVLAIVVTGGFATLGLPTICIIGTLLLGVTWVAYLQIPMANSRMIAQEKEQQTWDAILSLPYSWEDLILVKQAAALRSFHLNVMLWLQAFFVVVLYGTAISQVVGTSRSFALAGSARFIESYLALAIVALIAFTIGRVQDVVLLSLIGMAISVLASNRQTAVVGGVVAGAAYLLIWTVLALLVIPLIQPVSSYEPISTGVAAAVVGPAGSIVMALPLPAAIIGVVALIVYREVLIQAIFGWLSHHLSEA